MSDVPIPPIIFACIAGPVFLCLLFLCFRRWLYFPNANLRRHLRVAVQDVIQKRELQEGRRPKFDQKRWNDIMYKMLAKTEDGRELIKRSRRRGRREGIDKVESGDDSDSALLRRFAEAVANEIMDGSGGWAWTHSRSRGGVVRDDSTFLNPSYPPPAYVHEDGGRYSWGSGGYDGGVGDSRGWSSGGDSGYGNSGDNGGISGGGDSGGSSSGGDSGGASSS